MSSSHSPGCESAGIPVIGIVGGVGAGKSSVVGRVTGFRLFVIDADRVGHQQLTDPQIRDQIVNVFGNQVLNASGQISRPDLAAEVFGDSSDQKQKRQLLNEIVHPAIQKEIRRLMKSAPQDADAMVLDAALLLEAGWAEECDAVIFIDTPVEDRQKRVAETRGWSADEHTRREASQWSLEKKRKLSQFVVDNSGTPEEAAHQMEQVLKRILQHHKTVPVIEL